MEISLISLDVVACGLLRASGKLFHFHDPPHTTARVLLEQGVPLRVW